MRKKKDEGRDEDRREEVGEGGRKRKRWGGREREKDQRREEEEGEGREEHSRGFAKQSWNKQTRRAQREAETSCPAAAQFPRGPPVLLQLTSRIVYSSLTNSPFFWSRRGDGVGNTTLHLFFSYTTLLWKVEKD